ncbi:MAG: anti-sigma regulatory factor [candidate division WOR-3 bacterium]|nr:MAG: anti-sigma regulatory factor [candidate division WOR-3 bacterium]
MNKSDARSEVLFQQKFPIRGGDFVNAGDSSCKIRNTLREIGIDSDIIRRIAITAYEAEMNVVMYAERGVMSINVYRDEILLTIDDKGPGIENIDLAMQPGYSTATEEMREMGFGAGMGLPNMKKNADTFKITTEVGKGTRLEIKILLDGKND